MLPRRQKRAALIAAIVALIAVLALPGAATAGNAVGVDEAQEEVDRALVMVDESVEAAEAGDADRGYDLARSAYLDHFELVEIPLRLRNPNLVLDLEFAFADLRDGIRDGESIGSIQDDAREVRARLRDVSRELESKGFAAPALAFGFSFTILFREGLEAVLLIAVLLGSLEAARAADYRRPLAWGIAGAVLATAVTFMVATFLIDIAPVNREVIEAVASLLAVAVLFWVSFWLVSRLEQKRWMEFMRARTSSAIAAGGALAFAGLGFTAVYREGFETVLFYQTLTLFAAGLTLWVVLGAVAAAVALAGVGYAIFGLGRKLPLKPLLIGGVSILLLLSVAFAGNAVRALQEVDIVNATPIEGGWARLPIFLAEVTGIHPTKEGIAVQAALLGLYVLGAIYMFAWRPLRDRRTAGAEAA
ncbi:MAG TPA: FTR1 family protein [Solirubrobacterales bacterium]|nr:FTR1 family protein [Solirubrobacterales bacterium]